MVYFCVDICYKKIVMMYKPSLALLVSFIAFQCCKAQEIVIKFDQIGGTIPEPEQLSPFKAVWNSALAHADIDNDGDTDIILSGNNINTEEIFTDLYLNNGGGNYVLLEDNGIVGVADAALAFGDVDGDDDMDLLLSGASEDGATSILYLNDGNGLFEDSGVALPSLAEPAVAFMNNGSVLNILMAGLDDGVAKTYLYSNDGELNFTEVDHDLVNVEKGMIDVADADFDGYDDILIAGKLADGTAVTKVYIASDTETFVEDADLLGIYDGDLSFVNLGDGIRLNIVISGAISESNSKSRTYYYSNVLGYTTVSSGQPNQGSNHGFRNCSIAVGDINDDEDNDLLIVGYNDYAEGPILIRYNNNGFGVTTSQNDVRFLASESGAVDYIDFDNDGDMDLFFTGSGFARIYEKDGISFTPMMGTPFDGVSHGNSDFGDIDGDGDMDIIISGYLDQLSNPEEAGGEETKLYINDGNGVYTRENISLFDLSGSLAMTDINGDDLADFSITNTLNYSTETRFYTSNGDGSFAYVSFSGVPQYGKSILRYGDVDGDDDMDLFMMGVDNMENNISALYLNDGNGLFTVDDLEIEGSDRHQAIVQDIDNDDDIDFIHIGNNEALGNYTHIYTNDGEGNFELTTETNIDSPLFPALSFGDLNGDDYIDLIVSGNYSEIPGGLLVDTKVYFNDGDGSFTEELETALTPIVLGDAEIFDVDGDGDHDVLVSGQTVDDENVFEEQVYVNHLFLNDGTGAFAFEMSLDLEDCRFVHVKTADIDGDGDLDLWQTGEDINGHGKASIWRNNSCLSSSASISEEVCDSYVKPDGELLTETGIYEFTTINATGCDSLVTLDLTVKNATSSTDNITACDAYLWIDGNEYTASNTTATFTLTNTVGCDSVVSLNLTINSFDNNIAQNGSELSVANGADSYQWIDCDDNDSEIAGATSANFTAIVDGSYAVMVNYGECSSTSNCVSVLGIGIDEDSFSKQIELFPNPNQGIFTVDMGLHYEEIECEIFDIYGALVFVSNHQNKRVISMTDKLAAGIYLIKLQAADQQTVIRFTVQ